MDGHNCQVFKTHSAQETLAFGEALGRSLLGGLVLGLVGPLGAGKTQLVKGIALGNGLEDVRQVTSPTFTLVHEYPGRLALHHIDAYRLRGPQDLASLGFDELIQADAAVVVEWADRARALISPDALWITIAPTAEQQRSLAFEAGGTLAFECLNRLQQLRV
jgi:tRNA threonylcarbamoyladenosine biosynthesis protein TsaE